MALWSSLVNAEGPPNSTNAELDSTIDDVLGTPKATLFSLDTSSLSSVSEVEFAFTDSLSVSLEDITFRPQLLVAGIVIATLPDIDYLAGQSYSNLTYTFTGSAVESVTPLSDWEDDDTGIIFEIESSGAETNWTIDAIKMTIR